MVSGCSNVYRNTRGLVLLSFVHEGFSLARMEPLLVYTAVNKRIWPKVLRDVAFKRQKVNAFL